MQAEIAGAPGENQHADGAPPPGRHPRGRAQREHRIRVAEAEKEQDARVPRHRKKRVVRHRCDGVRRGPSDEAPDRCQEQGAPHLDHHFLYLDSGSE